MDAQTSTPDVWITLLNNFGVPSAMLFLITFGMWKVLRWSGLNLIIPIRDNLVFRMGKFFDKLETAMDSVVTNVEKLTNYQAHQTSTLEKQTVTLSKLEASSTAQAEVAAKILEKVTEKLK
jgi:cell shape-determining protein MreC